MRVRRHNVALGIVTKVDTATSMKDVAASGHAFTLLPMTAVAQEVAAGVLSACRVTSPGIRRTVVRQPLEAMTLAAVERLCGLLDGDTSAPQIRVLPNEIVRRATSA